MTSYLLYHPLFFYNLLGPVCYTAVWPDEGSQSFSEFMSAPAMSCSERSTALVSILWHWMSHPPFPNVHWGVGRATLISHLGLIKDPLKNEFFLAFEIFYASICWSTVFWLISLLLLAFVNNNTHYLYAVFAPWVLRNLSRTVVISGWVHSSAAHMAVTFDKGRSHYIRPQKANTQERTTLYKQPTIWVCES